MKEQEIPRLSQRLQQAEETGLRPAERPEAERASLWTIEDVAAYLQVPIGSIYRMTARKARVRIPHIRIGSTLRFRKADIEQWLSLLTVSNLRTLKRLHQRIQKVTHGKDSQEEAAFR